MESPGRLFQGQFGKTQLLGTGGGGGKGEVGDLTQSLQQAQDSSCTSEGGRWPSRGAWALGHSSLPVAGRQEGSWKLVQGLAPDPEERQWGAVYRTPHAHGRQH